MSLRIARWFHKHGLSRKKLKGSFVYRIFGERIISKSLWRFEKGSVIRGWIIGCFAASNPFLGAQITMAAPFLLLFRANVFVAIVVIFATNPLTIVPFLTGAYFIGAWMLNLHPENLPDAQIENEIQKVPDSLTNLSLSDLWNNPTDTALAVTIGCLLIAIVTSVVGALLIALLWKQKPARVRRAHPHHKAAAHCASSPTGAAHPPHPPATPPTSAP